VEGGPQGWRVEEGDVVGELFISWGKTVRGEFVEVTFVNLQEYKWNLFAIL